MKKLRLFLAASVLGLGACGESTLLAPEAPRFDNGSTFGTGYRSSDSTGVNTTAGTISAERNGSTFGTGY